MNKIILNSFLAGFFVGLVILGMIFVFFQPAPIIEQSQKMKECIEAGGEFQVRDWSFKDDGSDYRATCDIPEHKLWEINVK